MNLRYTYRFHTGEKHVIYIYIYMYTIVRRLASSGNQGNQVASCGLARAQGGATKRRIRFLTAPQGRFFFTHLILSFIVFWRKAADPFGAGFAFSSPFGATWRGAPAPDQGTFACLPARGSNRGKTCYIYIYMYHCSTPRASLAAKQPIFSALLLPSSPPFGA